MKKMCKVINTQKYIDYLSVFMLLAISGNPVIIRAPWYQSLLIFIGAFQIILLLWKTPKQFLKKISLYIAFFLAVFTIQYFNFGWNTLPGILGFSLKCLIGGYIIWHLKERFIPVYTNIMVFISGVSLFFFLLSLLGIIVIPNIIPVFDVTAFNSLGIYIDVNNIPKRNFGMFWEPGAFAGYILLAFMLNMSGFWESFKNGKLKYFILFISLLTTRSTAGYIVLFTFIVFLNFNYLKRKWIIGLPILILSIGLIYYSFFQFSFLNNKIVSEYEHTQDLDGRYDPSRIGSLLFDLHYIKKNPLSGNGLHEKTRFADHPQLRGRDRGGAGNGFSNFIASMGSLSFMFVIYLIFKSLKFSFSDKVFFLILFLLLLQSEQYLNFPLFLGLPFINSGVNTPIK